MLTFFDAVKEDQLMCQFGIKKSLLFNNQYNKNNNLAIINNNNIKILLFSLAIGDDFLNQNSVWKFHVFGRFYVDYVCVKAWAVLTASPLNLIYFKLVQIEETSIHQSNVQFK